MLEADLKTVPEFYSLMPIDSLFFRWVYYQTQKKKYNDKRKLNLKERRGTKRKWEKKETEKMKEITKIQKEN